MKGFKLNHLAQSDREREREGLIENVIEKSDRRASGPSDRQTGAIYFGVFRSISEYRRVNHQAYHLLEKIFSIC